MWANGGAAPIVATPKPSTRYTMRVMELERAATPPTASPGSGTGDLGDRSVQADAERAERARGIRRVLLVVLGLNLLVAALKLGYGLASGSVAMSADGVQSLLDGLANVVGLVGIAVAARPPDREHHYGHERYETLASMAIAGLMAIGMVEVVQGALGQLQSGSRPEVTSLSFAILAATMAINAGVAVWERRAGGRLRSGLLQADARHTASDVLVSGAVIVGLAAERVGVNGADAIVSLAIAGVIAWAAWGIVREASLVLTDATFADPRDLMAAVLAAPGVVTAHNLRARSSGGRVWVEVHVTVDPAQTVGQAHEVATAVEWRVRDAAGPLAQATVHVEPAEPPHTRPDRLFGNE